MKQVVAASGPSVLITYSSGINGFPVILSYIF